MIAACRAVDRLPATQDRDTALHDLRKKAKRARYAAESATGALGARGTQAAAHAAHLQDVLGAYHDGVVAQQHLRQLAEKRSTTKADAYTLGRLAGIEYSETLRILEGLPDAERRSVRFRTFGS
jgi:CHAD domain-containing protein